jgi:hypothetical protein
LGFDHLDFVQADVRDLSVGAYGCFDVVVASGILYHLDTLDVFKFVEDMYEMTSRLVVIDTNVSPRAEMEVQYHGQRYRGLRLAHSVPEDPIEKSWGPVGGTTSFMFTRRSLVNLLGHVGFSSIYECLSPAHLDDLGRPRYTFAAVKGEEMRSLTLPPWGARIDLPEDD